MAVSTTNAYSGPYTANGSTTSFPFTFSALTSDDVAVLLRATDGTETVADTDDYTVTFSGTVPSAGAVVFDTAPASGVLVLPYLDVAFTQETAFADGSAWKAAAVNNTNDRAALRDQVLKRDVARGLLVPMDETGFTLPSAADRAGAALFFDESGDAKTITIDDFSAPAAGSAAAAAVSAAVAEAAAGPNYANTTDGLAATTNGQSFAVDNGDGTVTVYLNDGGTAVAQRRLATVASMPFINALQYKTGSLTDTQAVQAAITAAASANAIVAVPKLLSPDWSAITLNRVVTIIDEANGRIIPGRGAAFQPGGVPGGGEHAVLMPVQDNFGWLYVEPRGANAWKDEDFPGAIKVFAAEYDTGKRLDGVTDNSFTDYVNGGLAFHSRAGAHGGRMLIWSKSVNNYGPMHPDIEFTLGGETTQAGMRICYVEPRATPAGPYNAGGGRINLIRGASWRPSMTVAQGDRFIFYGRVYEACNAGTLGTTPPYHDDAGGIQRDAANSGNTVIGTSETIGGWTGYTAMNGAVKLAFIADVYYGSGWTGWRGAPVLGDPTVDPVLGSGLHVQFSSPFGIRQGDAMVALNPSTGAQLGRVRSVANQMVMESGATAGASTNARFVADTNSAQILGKPLLIGSSVTKTDAATSLALTGDQNTIVFNDTAATNFTGFTGLVTGAEYTLLFNTGNTTLVHGSSIQIKGAANYTPGQFECIKARAVSTTLLWLFKS